MRGTNDGNNRPYSISQHFFTLEKAVWLDKKRFFVTARASKVKFLI